MDIQQATKIIRKNLFPFCASLPWHNKLAKDELNILKKTLHFLDAERFDLLNESQRHIVHSLAATLSKYYYDYTLDKDVHKYNPSQINLWLVKVAEWFESREKEAEHTPMMCSLFKKIGHLYVKKMFGSYSISIEGGQDFPPGPFVIASSHHYGDEQFFISLLINRHI